MRAQLDGAVLQSLTLRDSPVPLPPRAPRSDVDAAEAAVQQAQSALEDVQDSMAALQRKIGAAEAQMAFLSALASSESLPQEAGALAAIAAMIGTETEAAASRMAEAQIALRPLAREAVDRREDVVRAQAALDALLTAGTDRQQVTLLATAAEAGEVTLRFTYLVR